MTKYVSKERKANIALNKSNWTINNKTRLDRIEERLGRIDEKFLEASEPEKKVISGVAKITLLELNRFMAGYKIYKQYNKITLEKIGVFTIELNIQQWEQLFSDIERLNNDSKKKS